MIVRMKEILLFTTASSVDQSIQQLGHLGVVDIKEDHKQGNGTLEGRLEALHRSENAISILTDFAKGKKERTEHLVSSTYDPKKLIDRILSAEEIRQKGQQNLNSLNLHLQWYQTWGEKVDVKDIQFLRNMGIYLRLYLLDRSSVASMSKEFPIELLSERDGKVPVVLLTRNKAEKLPFKEVELPHLPFVEIKKQIERRERQLATVRKFFEDQSNNLNWLKDYRLHLKAHFDIQKVQEGMGDIESRLKYLRGYIPDDAIAHFVEVAEANHWGYSISKPENPEEVPVYIRNPKWISIINPVMKFIDIVPGYQEVDVSIYFLMAFALFFAMLVGDAGYGAIFLLITLLFRKKISQQMRVLMYVLSGATIVWGVLSGTYFGAENIAALPVLKDLVIGEISSFGKNNTSFMMHLSFLIGAIHLTIAHGIRFFQFINSIRALSEVGWIALVWGLFLVTEQLVLGKDIPAWSLWLFLGGATFVALFSMESKSFLKSMGISIANLPLSLISGFSDIVSYVRLFAVGMATVAVAASFNDMILPEGIAGMGVIHLIIASIALFLGHGLNIALALMAVMVHGIRLNMLEFSGHLGVQFSGEAYKPFILVSSKNMYEEKAETSAHTEKH